MGLLLTATVLLVLQNTINAIPGPKTKNDSIVIVGADFTGIHMALLLKNRGFTNVQILERENRVGGGLFDSYSYRGKPEAS